MPIQVLPYVPTFLEQLQPQLNQLGESIGQGIEQRAAMKGLNALLTPQQAPSSGTAVSGLQNTQPTAANTMANLSPIQMVQAYKLAEKATKSPQAAKVLTDSMLQQQKLNQKEQAQIRQEQRAIQNQTVQKSLETGIGQREAIRKQRFDLNSALSAVQQGQVGGFDRNYWANLLGEKGEPLKNASGVQLQAASKNLLVDSLSKLTGRPNQWIDQQIFSASPGIGKSAEANETIIATSLAKLDIDEKILDAKDELVKFYSSQGIQIPANIDQLAEKTVQPYAQHVQDKLAYDLRVLFEREKGNRYLNSLEKVPQGTPLTLEKRDALIKKYNGDKAKARETAEKMGYTIPNPAIFQKAEQ